MTDDNYSPPQETKGDQAHKVIRSAIGAVPVVGPAGVEMFSSLFSPPLVKRNEKWMNDIADGLKRLEAKSDLDIEQLANNDAFIDVLLTATRIAAQTSNALKQESLVNAVLNASKDQEPDEALQQMFLETLLGMTEWHLRLLNHFGQPYPGEIPEGSDTESAFTDVYYPNIFIAMPELVEREGFVKLVIQDLTSRQLISVLPQAESKITTSFADQFLSFIGETGLK